MVDYQEKGQIVFLEILRSNSGLIANNPIPYIILTC
jgi:hypothetical protein